jgi:prepilin-type processing-associated H-X9-DG protein
MVVGELATNQVGEHFHFTSTRGGASRISPNQFKAEVNVQCHNAGANYLFADGHSEKLSWNDVQIRLNQASPNLLMP